MFIENILANPIRGLSRAGMARRQVVIGILGPILDSGSGAGRWEKWRPTLALCSQEDLIIDRFELLCQKGFEKLAGTIVADIASVSPETEVHTHSVFWNDPWDFEEVYAALLDFARSYSFRDSEDYLIHITTGTHVAQICLFLLTEARYLPGRIVQCSPPPRQKSGASGDFRIIDLDLSRYDRIASRFKQERHDDLSFLKKGIVTKNVAFNQLIEEIEKVAVHSRSPILLMGPTGAGKSELARRIFDLKKKRNQVVGIFVEVNCATLRGDAAMSALFGHVRGAFTGAQQARPGLLRAADNGILFLDEIGELGLDEQAMLLRAVEEKRFLPLGSDVEVTSNFQLIAGTNRSLGVDVREGRFREDLLARINLWTYRLPGLQNRPEDIAPNLEFELVKYAEKNSRFVRFSREAQNRFLEFAVSQEALWKGNFRDLNAAVTRMATLSPGGRINLDIVEKEMNRLSLFWDTESEEGEASPSEFERLPELIGKGKFNELDLFEKIQLAGVIHVCRRSDSLASAGRKLFAVSRKAVKQINDSDRLRKYLGRYGIDWTKIHKSPAR